MAKYFPNLVEKSTVADAKAITTTLHTHNKVYVEETQNSYDWLRLVSFPESLPDVIDVTSQTADGRLMKVGSFKKYEASLTVAEIETQLEGSSVVAVGEVATLTFDVPGLKAGSNINTVITNLSANAIPEGVTIDEDDTVDEDGKVVVVIRNESYYVADPVTGELIPTDFTIPALDISVVELLGN